MLKMNKKYLILVLPIITRLYVVKYLVYISLYIPFICSLKYSKNLFLLGFTYGKVASNGTEFTQLVNQLALPELGVQGEQKRQSR